jgi:hypothetical protein
MLDLQGRGQYEFFLAQGQCLQQVQLGYAQAQVPAGRLRLAEMPIYFLFCGTAFRQKEDREKDREYVSKAFQKGENKKRPMSFPHRPV